MRVDPKIIANSPKDALSAALDSVRIESVFFGMSEFASPWGVAVGKKDSIILHVQLEGRSWLEVDGMREAVEVEAGDLLLLPHGKAHRLRASLKAKATPIERLIETARHGILQNREDGRPVDTRLLCGGFTVFEAATNPLLRALPDVLRIPAVGRKEWLETTLGLIAGEASAGAASAGSAAVIRRLADVLLVQCLRHYIEGGPLWSSGCPKGSWLQGMGDARVATALQRMHSQPEAAWTVETLAAESGMSRSGFADLFARLVGEPPLGYLMKWRMHIAGKLLRESKEGLAEIAARVGYQSEAAFSRVFRQQMGVAPGRYRRMLVA
jgi:AraC-like DNA-binding protein